MWSWLEKVVPSTNIGRMKRLRDGGREGGGREGGMGEKRGQNNGT